MQHCTHNTIKKKQKNTTKNMNIQVPLQNTRTVKKMIKDFLFSTKNDKEGYNKVHLTMSLYMTTMMTTT